LFDAIGFGLFKLDWFPLELSPPNGSLLIDGPAELSPPNGSLLLYGMPPPNEFIPPPRMLFCGMLEPKVFDESPMLPKGSDFLFPPPNFIGPPIPGLLAAGAKGSFYDGLLELAKGSEPPPIFNGASSHPPKLYYALPTFG
jgi:hypothetical protein